MVDAAVIPRLWAILQLSPAMRGSLSGKSRRAEPHDARLPAHSLDRAILVHMYHVPAFKPGASLGIVDAIAPTSQHGTPPNLLRCELAAVGYREIAFHSLRGSSAYLAIFAPPAEEDRTRPEAMIACHTNTEKAIRPDR